MEPIQVKAGKPTVGKLEDRLDASVDKTVLKLEARLMSWRARLDALAAKAEAAGQEVKAESRKQLDELKAQFDAAQTKLDEAKSAGAARRDSFKHALEGSMTELEAGLDRQSAELSDAIVSSYGRTVATLDDQLTRWERKLDGLVAKAEAAGEQARSESRKNLSELELRLDAARSKLDAAKAAGAGKWGAFKRAVERAWNELEAGFEDLVQ